MTASRSSAWRSGLIGYAAIPNSSQRAASPRWACFPYKQLVRRIEIGVYSRQPDYPNEGDHNAEAEQKPGAALRFLNQFRAEYSSCRKYVS
jgi:hypothetical protein